MHFTHAIVRLYLSTLGKRDDPRISFPVLPDCVGDIRPRHAAHMQVGIKPRSYECDFTMERNSQAHSLAINCLPLEVSPFSSKYHLLISLFHHNMSLNSHRMTTIQTHIWSSRTVVQRESSP